MPRGERTGVSGCPQSPLRASPERGAQGTLLRTKYPRQRSSRGQRDRTLGQEEDQGSKSVLLRNLGVCIIWTKLCQEEITQAQDENTLRALGEQHISEKPSNRKDPGIAPRQMAKKTVSTDSDYTFFMFVSSKIKYGWFKKSSKSKLFWGNGKVNETEKETMSDRTAWLWI